MSITCTIKGDWLGTEKFLKGASTGEYLKVLNKFGAQGQAALAAATPTETGRTANSWSYKVEIGRGESTIYWSNSHVNKGVNIALILQYGHGTRNGGYVQGRDYINPAMQPIFDKIADEALKAVSSL